MTQQRDKSMSRVQESGGFKKIKENREALEELSDSDLPVAEIATALLELEGGA